VGRRCLLGLGSNLDADRIALGILGGFDELDLLLPFGNLDLARRKYLLLSGNHLGARRFGHRLGLRLRPRLFGNRDGALLLGDLEKLAALDFEALDIAFASDPLGFDRPLLGDAGALELLMRLDLRFPRLEVTLRPLPRQYRA